MFDFIKKKISSKETIVLFIIFSIISFKDFLFSCINYPSLDFNSQIPLTWDFTSLNGLLPYRDVFHPYGILFYLKNQNAFFGFIYLFLPAILFTGFFITFRKIFENKLLAYISLILFYAFISKYLDVESFIRYGVISASAFLFSYIFYKSSFVSNKSSFFIGIFIGTVFSLINDQGIYTFLLFIFLIVISPILKFGIKEIKRTEYYKFLLPRLLANIFGIFLGFLPFLFFLTLNGLNNDFFSYINQLSDFKIHLKTPFIPYSMTIDNLFTFGGLLIAIFSLSYKLFFNKRKVTFIFFIQLSLVFVLTLLEQKNIVRSIDRQITFVALLLYIILFCEVWYILARNKINDLIIYSCYLIISILIIFNLGLNSFVNMPINFNSQLPKIFMSESIARFLVDKSTLCLNNNLENLLSKENQEYKRIKDVINKDSGGYTKIFDYLSDPVFYVLFNQKPPYYFTIFEASPFYAQESNIKYLEENEVKYVIYNTEILKIQDGVPDYLRGSVLFRYLISKFGILQKIDNFIIFEIAKNENFDFFNDANLNKSTSFKSYLLNVDLGSIPHSEGIHKSKFLRSSQALPFTNLASKDKIIVLELKKKDVKKVKLSFITEVGETTVEFDPCKSGFQCVVNLKNIPLFYKDRVIKKIDYDASVVSKIKIIEGIPDNIF